MLGIKPPMFFLTIADDFAQRVNDAGFLAALILVTLFYKEYKRQMTLMQHDELIDNFLNDKPGSH
jgi:hypothetical protein